MKILIRFGDNDFGPVLRSFGALFLADGRTWNPERLTEANIVRWFNTTALVLYEMTQAHHRKVSKTEEERLASLKNNNYLTITEDRVVIGDAEVKAWMDRWNEWGNAEAVLIDFGRPHIAPTVTIV